MYSNLDISIKKALEQRVDSNCELLVTCFTHTSLHNVIELFVSHEAHRLIIIDENDRVIGIICLSDVLAFLITEHKELNELNEEFNKNDEINDNLNEKQDSNKKLNKGLSKESNKELSKKSNEQLNRESSRESNRDLSRELSKESNKEMDEKSNKEKVLKKELSDEKEDLRKEIKKEKRPKKLKEKELIKGSDLNVEKIDKNNLKNDDFDKTIQDDSTEDKNLEFKM